MVRILVAPDKFKGSLTATAVADAVAAGLRSADPTLDIVCLPVADGGDGTVAAVTAAGWASVPVATVGPTGEPLNTTYARRGDTAVVELASAVGLELLTDLDPLGASTFGLGVVIAAALEAGATRIVLGLGGSASTDGGAGMLQALGARILDSDGNEIDRGGAAVLNAVRLDTSNLVPQIHDCSVVLACDVDNPLLGPTGATAVYAPQKGAVSADLVVLEDAMTRWASVVRASTHREVDAVPGSGAAGGTAFGAIGVLGAVVKPGIETVLDLIDFHRHLAVADLVVTGEGSLDRQSLYGKAPIGVADVAHASGVPVVTVSGRKTVPDETLRQHGIFASFALSDLEPDVAVSMRDAAVLLQQIGRSIAHLSLTTTPEGAS